MICYSFKASELYKLQQAIAKLDAFKAKWPKDYKSRCGYDPEDILDLVRKMMATLPKLTAEQAETRYQTEGGLNLKAE